ncbi:MAG: hypothetical protein J6P29_06870 [Acetobacter sp.]|nr:hypothetical protein [Acetobacter sp.]
MGKVLVLGTCMLLGGCASLDKFTENVAASFEKNPDMWPTGLKEPVPFGPGGFLLDLPCNDSHASLHGKAILRDGEEISLGEKEKIRHGMTISYDFNNDINNNLDKNRNINNGLPVGKVLEKDNKNNKSNQNVVNLHFQTIIPLVIPNKDGTETIINPNGNIKTVHDSHLAIPVDQTLSSEDALLDGTNKENTLSKKVNLQKQPQQKRSRIQNSIKNNQGYMLQQHF